MLSRKYNRKIEIFKTTDTPDGYGGNIATNVSLGSFWAEVKQNSAFRDNSIGKSDIKDNWNFNIRSNPILTPDLDNLSVTYRGVNRVVNDIRYNDELFREINIIANGG